MSTRSFNVSVTRPSGPSASTTEKPQEQGSSQTMNSSWMGFFATQTVRVDPRPVPPVASALSSALNHSGHRS